MVKGKQLYVQGRLKLEEWKDKEGNNKYTLAIIANTIQLLGSKNDSGGQEQDYQITIIGNVGKDPEVKYLPDGLMICNFSVAENEKVKGVPVTTWYKVAAFGKLAEICDKYVVKGKQLYVQGRLKLEEWKDKEGNNKYTLAITASTIQLLGLQIS